jgi:hypothetical protein
MQQTKADRILNDDTIMPNLEYHQCRSCKLKFYDDSTLETIEAIEQKGTEKI